MFRFQTLKSQDAKNAPPVGSQGYAQSRSIFDSHSNSPYLENLDNYRREDASRDLRYSNSRHEAGAFQSSITDPKNSPYGKSSSYKLEGNYHIQQDEEDDYYKRSNKVNTAATRGPVRTATAPTNSVGDAYDEWAIPPNMDYVEKHKLATQVGMERKHVPGVYPETCPCCGYEVERNFFNLCVSTDELGYLGPGYPLYFNFMRLCFLLILLTFGMNGLYNLITNYNGWYCHRPMKQVGKAHCSSDLLNTLSYINKIDAEGDIKEMQEYLNITTIVFLMILMFMFRKYQRALDSSIDMGFQTPKDYTIIVKNIPISPYIDYHGELRKLFGLFAGNIRLNVKKITLTSDSHDLKELEKQLERELDKKRNSYKGKDRDEQIQTEKNILELEENIRKASMQALLDPKCFTGVALISFGTEDEKMLVVKKTQMATWTRIKDFFSNEKPAQDIQNLPKGSVSVFFHGKKLIIEEAPEPGDINWENIILSISTKIKWRMISFFIFLFIILISFGMFSLIYFIQRIFIDKATQLIKEGKSPMRELEYVDFFTFLLWVIFMYWNEFFLPYLFRLATHFEYWSTKSKATISVARKLAVAYFFNTALLFLLLNYFMSEEPFADGGFIQRENWILFLNTFIPPIVWVVDPWYIFTSIRRRIQLKKGNLSITQAEAQRLVENPRYDIAKRYADTIKTMWLVFFYAHVMPIALIWGMLGIFLYYWVDKINFLYRRTVKDILDLSVSIEMIEMIEYIIPLFGLAHFLFSYFVLEYLTWQSIFVFFAGITYLIIPMQMLNEMIFKISNKNETLNYDDVVGDFDDDYDRRNPVTAREAIKRWINFRRLGGRNYIPQNV